MEHQPVIKKKRGISPIWTLPIIAALICGWLLYKSYSEAGIEVTVYFHDATGIVPEKTQVMSMGIPLGVVKKLVPDLEKRMVKVIIRLDRSTEPYLVEDLKFWLVKPEVSAKRITGLDTILSGSYIGVQRGKSTKTARVFTALMKAPPILSSEPGLHISLKTTSLRSIQEGSAIYYQNIQIGQVKTYALQEDDSVLVEAFIRPDYSHLIRTGSRFYDASGITIAGTIPDLKIRMESVAALFTGGIVVGTPEPLKDTPLAQNGDTFTLYEDYKAAEYGIEMALKLASGTGIREGATKIMYRGLEAGTVTRVSINDDPLRSVTAHILLDPRAEIILRENTRFWLVQPEISINGVHNLNTILTGPYITFQPGDGEFKDEFEILSEPPVNPPLRAGRVFRLSSKQTPTSGSGAPVYYRKMKIGQLLDSDLSVERNSIITSIYIYDNYLDLVTPNVVFIESGGISIDADLSGFSFKMFPLVSTLKGGIDLVVPPRRERNQPISLDNDRLFALYPDYQAAVKDLPALMPEGLYLNLTAENLGSYRVGTPILFKKIKVGQIIGYDYDKEQKQVQLTCFIEDQYKDLISSTSKFYNASGIRLNGSLSGISMETESLEALIAGGISFFTTPGGEKIKNDQQFRVYESIDEARSSDHLNITVHFDNVAQLNVGAEVRYHGIRLGRVAETTFDKDLKSINALLNIERQYATFFRKDTKIWLSTPTIKISKVENLESVLFGASVIIEPGSGKLTTDFIGRNRAPHPFFTSFKGLGLVLETKHLGSLDIGSPVYYRRVKVGEVAGYDLAYDFKGVLVYIIIEERYAQLIRKNTKFWNASGVTVKGGVFSGITVSTESLEAIMAGGIALATPGGADMGGRVETGYRFTLFDKPEAGWLDWSPDIFVIEEEKKQPLR